MTDNRRYKVFKVNTYNVIYDALSFEEPQWTVLDPCADWFINFASAEDMTAFLMREADALRHCVYEINEFAVAPEEHHDVTTKD